MSKYKGYTIWYNLLTYFITIYYTYEYKPRKELKTVMKIAAIVISLCAIILNIITLFIRRK